MNPKSLKLKLNSRGMKLTQATIGLTFYTLRATKRYQEQCKRVGKLIWSETSLTTTSAAVTRTSSCMLAFPFVPLSFLVIYYTSSPFPLLNILLFFFIFRFLSILDNVLWLFRVRFCFHNALYWKFCCRVVAFCYRLWRFALAEEVFWRKIKRFVHISFLHFSDSIFLPFSC